MLRDNLAYEEIDDIKLTRETDNEQLTVAIRIDNNQKLFISTVYCPHGNPSMELIDGLTKNNDQFILTGDFNSKHPDIGNDQSDPSGDKLIDYTLKNNLTLINDGTPTFISDITGNEDILDLMFISQATIPNFRDFWVGDDHGSDHFIINGVFSYTPIYNKTDEKTVRLFHKADWLDINFSIRTIMNETKLNKRTITTDEIDNYVDKLTNTINRAIIDKVPTKAIKRQSVGLPSEIRELIRQKRQQRRFWKRQEFRSIRLTLTVYINELARTSPLEREIVGKNTAMIWSYPSHS